MSATLHWSIRRAASWCRSTPHDGGCASASRRSKRRDAHASLPSCAALQSTTSCCRPTAIGSRNWGGACRDLPRAALPARAAAGAAGRRGLGGAAPACAPLRGSLPGRSIGSARRRTLAGLASPCSDGATARSLGVAGGGAGEAGALRRDPRRTRDDHARDRPLAIDGVGRRLSRPPGRGAEGGEHLPRPGAGQGARGIVGYSAAPAAVQTPTTDRAPVRQIINAQFPDGATATGDALQVALQSITQDTGKGTGGKKPPAAIVLLSDGKTTTGRPPLEVATEAGKAKIPIYT